LDVNAGTGKHKAQTGVLYKRLFFIFYPIKI